jgi:hypothetical protein
VNNAPIFFNKTGGNMKSIYFDVNIPKILFTKALGGILPFTVRYHRSVIVIFPNETCLVPDGYV